ncbi:MAG: hypothetical protein ACP5HG_05000 [Anaerolineae bacterium]
MPYRFATEDENYSDYASGRVFYGLPGHPAFPVRLTSEIFQRCVAFCRRGGLQPPYTLYDPVCGSAYHLATLAFQHWEQIDQIVASDIDPEAVAGARQNLSLLTPEGLDRRIDEIETMLADYGKASHARALESTRRLKARLVRLRSSHAITTHVFVADTFDSEALIAELSAVEVTPVPIVIADVPYGQHATWEVEAETEDASPVNRMLGALLPIVHPQGVVAVAADKYQTIAHDCYRRLTRFKIGKRQTVFLQPLKT